MSVDEYSIGYTVIDVLPFLVGMPLDVHARCYLHALRPSEVRVLVGGEAMKMDSVMWRVTISTDHRAVITGIVQEVEVDLTGSWFGNGYTLRCETDRRRSGPGPRPPGPGDADREAERERTRMRALFSDHHKRST